ncbi:hypothetical protein ACFQ1Q_05235 [Winogradskyella litorisediminis]|uniref:Uncharacterized protein n=1 Tax=Winogradskyella litorisediminis TaxID=1156618 RepID=A0ABW3N5A6_9FLAO
MINLVNQNNILRQIKDIQVQAARLINRKSNLQEIEEFSNYSAEIKSFLLKNIEDKFILGHIHQIPDLSLDETNSNSRIFDVLAFSFDFGLGIYSRDKRKAEKALKKINDIQGKYASIEFMLKNYFE